MPYKIRKTKSGDYEVRSPNQVHAKHTSKANAEAQVRLLNAIEHNPDFIQKRKTKHGMD